MPGNSWKMVPALTQLVVNKNKIIELNIKLKIYDKHLEEKIQRVMRAKQGAKS